MRVLGQSETLSIFVSSLLIYQIQKLVFLNSQLVRIEANPIIKNLVIKNLLLFLNSHYQSLSPITNYFFNNVKINIIEMIELINFEIDELAFCWRWKEFLSPPEPAFYYLSRVLVTRISLQQKRSLKTKTFFSAKDFFQAKEKDL